MFKKVLFVVIVVAVLGLTTCGPKTELGQEGNIADNSQQLLFGTITSVEQGADGVQVLLATDDGDYSITISGIETEIFGRFEQITTGEEIEVSGTLLEGMEPPLVVAEYVKVVGSEVDYVMNLQGTVTKVELGKDGITAAIEALDGTSYPVTISAVTTGVIPEDALGEIEEGTVVSVSGELLDLNGSYISADTVVIIPAGDAGQE